MDDTRYLQPYTPTSTCGIIFCAPDARRRKRIQIRNVFKCLNFSSKSAPYRGVIHVHQRFSGERYYRERARCYTTPLPSLRNMRYPKKGSNSLGTYYVLVGCGNRRLEKMRELRAKHEICCVLNYKRKEDSTPIGVSPLFWRLFSRCRRGKRIRHFELIHIKVIRHLWERKALQSKRVSRKHSVRTIENLGHVRGPVADFVEREKRNKKKNKK